MTFLHPWLLGALVLAGIPILLHLLARREPPTVAFPAVRYLVQATEEATRRLRLQHWLLLALRTLLVAALVLAAAGPQLPARGVPGHAPSALVLVVDNSASSGAVRDGEPTIEALRSAARAVLARAGADDALWLLAADGVPRRGTAAELADEVARLAPSTARLDLGRAVALADELLATERRPGEIIVLSDLQRSAVGAATPRAPLLVARPERPAPANRGVAVVDPGAQPWPPEGGRVTIALAGDPGAGGALGVQLGDRPVRQGYAAVGRPADVVLTAGSAGWQRVAAELAPDELRADDRRVGVVRLAPPVRADCAGAGPWVLAACDVLEGNGRLRRGGEVSVGRLGAGPSVVIPPDDAAQLGALNRALARRGVRWQYGAPAAGGVTDSTALLPPTRVARRLALVADGSGRSGVLARVDGEPWLVRQDDVVLLGSRLDPAWTPLPVAPAFMPFMDALLNRVVRGTVTLASAAPGDAVLLPDLAERVVAGERAWPVEGGAAFTVPDTGLYFVLAGRDTLGAIAAGVDPRESVLAAADEAALRAAWPAARVASLDAVDGLAFSSLARADLRGPLLWLAALLALAEMVVAARGRRQA